MPDELEEKDFIHEENGKNPFPFWMIILIALAIMGFLWVGTSYFLQGYQSEVESKPFLQVTNRDFSIFLWQNTEYMRANVKEKTGYLPGFHKMWKVTPKAEQADEFVKAPPEILFLYHTWKRLIGNLYYPRPIMVEEFREFLKDDEQWLPRYWAEAPTDYVDLVENLDILENDDLEPRLPLIVKQAFQGWKVFFREGNRLNQLEPTVAQMETFIKANPFYARNYWRNLYPDYLQVLTQSPDREAKIPPEEFTSFLRFAYYLIP